MWGLLVFDDWQTSIYLEEKDNLSSMKFVSKGDGLLQYHTLLVALVENNYNTSYVILKKNYPLVLPNI